jgi:hypothetical protein
MTAAATSTPSVASAARSGTRSTGVPMAARSRSGSDSPGPEGATRRPATSPSSGDASSGGESDSLMAGDPVVHSWRRR